MNPVARRSTRPRLRGNLPGISADHHTCGRRGGFALVESVVGLALVTMMLGCVFALNAHVMRVLKDTKESAQATQMLHDRTEQLRSALWDQVTEPGWLETLAKGEIAAAVNFPDATETIRVEPLVPAPNVYAEVVRTPSGTVTKSGVSLSHYQSVKITLQVKWNGRRGLRERVMATVMTNGGI